MPINRSDLEEIFTYHPPNPVQTEQYNRIRTAAKEFAEILLDNTPLCPDQTGAIRRLRECVMIANSAIALKGKY